MKTCLQTGSRCEHRVALEISGIVVCGGGPDMSWLPDDAGTNARFSKARQSGFSLVEVLISLVIMSVGMLGIAGLYIQGMQAGRTSLFRHHAITLAGDVADRIRANPTAGIAYQHVGTATGSNNNCVAAGSNCNPAQMANNDIHQWQNQAKDTLPRGHVAIALDTAGLGAPPVYQVTIGWDEPGTTTPSYQIVVPVLPR